MGDVMELFGSSILQSLYSQAHNSSWEKADKVNSVKIPSTKPKLHWTCPPDEPHKRKQHVLKILGKGAELLCTRTNARAKRRLAKCNSETYRNRWKDITNGPRFWLFLGVYLGCAILKIGSRHLMKGKPEWVSQLGRNKLFGKLPTDLYRLWSANFEGHNHRDTMLFKKSIREQ